MALMTSLDEGHCQSLGHEMRALQNAIVLSERAAQLQQQQQQTRHVPHQGDATIEFATADRSNGRWPTMIANARCAATLWFLVMH